MPRIVSPVQPYMADNSAIIRAMQAGTEAGLKMPTTGGAILSGVQQGMQMATTMASFEDKYGADAKAAKERKAQMEQLQIQSAQQQLSRGELVNKQMTAESPYFGVKAANDAETSTLNLELARLQRTQAEAQTANLPLQISNKNTETQLDITSRALQLGEQQRALNAKLQADADRLELSDKLTKARTPDDFVSVRSALNAYWGKNGMADYDKLNAQFALEARVKGVASDPRVSGYINSGSPLTVAGVEKTTLTYQKLAGEAEKKLNAWANAFHNGGSFRLGADGEPAKDPATEQKIGEDWSNLKAVISENFQTPQKDAANNPTYGADGLPVMAAPRVADVMANLNFVGADQDGKLVFRNSAKSGNNTFKVDASDGNRLLDLIHYRDNLRSANEGVSMGVRTLRYMTDSQKSAISPDELSQLRRQFQPQPQAQTPPSSFSNGTTSVGGGPGVLPELPKEQQQPQGPQVPPALAPYVADWRAVYRSGNKTPNPITKGRLDALQANDPQAYAEVVRLGNAGVPATNAGAKTPASYYTPLP